jgi:glycosyltransferase involved in cell wall biosynthesis
MSKVLHIISGLNDGGAEGVLYRLVTNDKNNTHIVVSLTGEGKYGAMLKDAGIEVQYLRMKKNLLLPNSLLNLYRLIIKSNIDVVQTWMYHADLVGGVIARLAGVKKVFWGIRHSELTKEDSSRTVRIIAKICSVLSHIVPKKIICCAEYAKNAHVALGYSSNRMVVISNGYDLTKTGSLSISSDLKVAVGCDFKFILGMVARYHPQKDHRTLLKSLSLVRAKGLDIGCVLVGDGTSGDNSELQAMIDSYCLESSVILCGARKDIPNIMRMIDLHVLSSSSGEGFPNVVAEAMLNKTPCVVTDVGDAKYIVADFGWVVAPKDYNAMSDKITKAYNEFNTDSVAWNNRCSNSENRIRSEYSIEKMVNRFNCEWEL